MESLLIQAMDTDGYKCALNDVPDTNVQGQLPKELKPFLAVCQKVQELNLQEEVIFEYLKYPELESLTLTQAGHLIAEVSFSGLGTDNYFIMGVITREDGTLKFPADISNFILKNQVDIDALKAKLVGWAKDSVGLQSPSIISLAHRFASIYGLEEYLIDTFLDELVKVNPYTAEVNPLFVPFLATNRQQARDQLKEQILTNPEMMEVVLEAIASV